jgi:hypothetical protein
MRRNTKLRFIPCFFTLFVMMKIASPELSCSAAAAEHPRLILTPQKIEYLKSSVETTHRHLWKQVIALADNFRNEPIPRMEDAHNRWRYIGDTMPVLGLVYLMSGNSKYVEAAENWIKALLDVPEWKGSSNLGRSAWVTGCALLYDWLYDELNEQTLARIRSRLQKEGSILVEDAAVWRSLSNHLLIETTALGMIGLTLDGEIPEAAEFSKIADQRTMQIITDAPLDGSWGEGVQYWQYGLGYFLRFLEASYTSGFNDYYAEYNWLKLTGFFPIYFSLPGRPTQVINFSDCGSDRYLPAFLFYFPASHYHQGYFQKFAEMVQFYESHKFSWLDFIAYNPSVPTKDIVELPTLKHFADNDFVTMRSSWDRDATTIGFRCGPAPGHRNQQDSNLVKKHGFGPGHGHPDINSFNIFAYGEWLAIDPGYSKLKETRNHNTVIVNGHGQAGEGKTWLDYMAFESREPAPAILRVESNPVYDYVLGDAGNIYVDAASLQYFRRHLLFLKPGTVVILDDLTAKSESQFEWLLNARDSIEAIGNGNFQIVRNKVRLWIHPILPTNHKVLIYDREVDASDVRDETDIAGGKMKSLNLQIGGVTSTRYLVVLCPLKNLSAEPPEVDFRNNLLSIKHADQKFKVSIIETESLKNADDPALVIKEPTWSGEMDYHFIRTSEK